MRNSSSGETETPALPMRNSSAGASTVSETVARNTGPPQPRGRRDGPLRAMFRKLRPAPAESVPLAEPLGCVEIDSDGHAAPAPALADLYSADLGLNERAPADEVASDSQDKSFPMYVMKVSDFMMLDLLPTHNELLAQGRVVPVSSLSDDVTINFVSHRAQSTPPEWQSCRRCCADVFVVAASVLSATPRRACHCVVHRVDWLQSR
jgi:hypothetical protein